MLFSNQNLFADKKQKKLPVFVQESKKLFSLSPVVRARKVISDIKIRRDAVTNESATVASVIGQGRRWRKK